MLLKGLVFPYAQGIRISQDEQRDDGAPAVAHATRDSTETKQEPCP
jgi:DNA-directed RNA polymerase subunit M